MVRAALAHHPALLTPPETSLLEHLHGDAAHRWGDLDAGRERRPWRQHLGFTRKQHRESLDMLQAWLPTLPSASLRPSLRMTTFKRQFIELLDAMAVHRNRSMWLESSPGHLLYLREIDRLAPDARYVHVIRRGTDVLASLLDACLLLEDRHGLGGGVMRWARRWTRAMQIHQAHASHAQHHMLFIDDLFVQPQAEWQRLCAFLDIDAQPLLDRMGDDAALPSIDAHESWMLGFRHLPRHRIEALLSPAMQRWLHAALGAYDALRDDLYQRRGMSAPSRPEALTAMAD